MSSSNNTSWTWESISDIEDVLADVSSRENGAIVPVTPEHDQTKEATLLVPVILDDVPAGMLDDWQLSPSPAMPLVLAEIPTGFTDDWQLTPSPPVANRAAQYDAAAIERKRQAALKRRHEKEELHREEVLRHRAIDARPCRYDASAIEVKRQAALKHGSHQARFGVA